MKDKWIKTTEKLPEKCCRVLVIRKIEIEGYGTTSTLDIARIDGNRWVLDSQQWCILPCTPTIDSGIITHWMPLPKKPSLN